jgi:DNA-binding NtrC family response regulator
LYAWPGNVRELDAALRRSVAFATGTVLRPEDILIDNTTTGGRSSPLSAGTQRGFSALSIFSIQGARTTHSPRAGKAGGNQTAASALLGISKQAVSKFLADNRS